ncbi:MAG: acetone carboxylase, beta subunit [Solirubrobacterales bacterium]|jgi:N-methylhydantoinase A/acetone carboxylase beta subunit|nr:acetone carboxylase, beta subunit [Solirubrobacterales bacterium]
MTDVIMVDSNGHFVVGKAQTTPHDESIGFADSAEDALGLWNIPTQQGFGEVVSGVFSGTSMLNRLLERKGQRVGVMVTRGQEDALRFERGIQTWLNLSYADMFHAVVREHNEPLVPLSRIKGIGGRIAPDGSEAIPLYEEDVRRSVKELLAEEVDCICVNLLFSWRNSDHEERTRTIAEETMKEEGQEVPIYLSVEQCPKRLDFSRLNTLVIEAYAVEPGRIQLDQVRARTRELGASFDLRVMAGSGSTISIDSTQLVHTLVSGPIGGCVGAKYLSEQLDAKNVVCADIGGTSFDVALITGGESEIKSNPEVAYFKMNFPMVRIDSIGAGTGSFVRVNPVTGRIEFGPESAGARIGVSNPDSGLETVTISDCDVALGLINPNNFLGGQVILDRGAAIEAIREQLAEPLGISVEEAAAGAIELFEDELRRAMRSLVAGKGFEPADFKMLGYGGGGPLHLAAAAEGLHFDDVLVPSWAAGFSAFGCTCADAAYRFDRQIDMSILPDSSDEHRTEVAKAITAAWGELRGRIESEFGQSGTSADQISYRPAVRLQYSGQLNDIEILSPVEKLETAEDLQLILDEFERVYGNIYADAARSPELGYFVTLAILTGSIDVEKPIIPQEPIVAKEPPSEAYKEPRQVWSKGRWVDGGIFEMDLLQAGNVIPGPAVIEAPSTTLVVPEGQTAELDEHRIFHIS